MNKKVTSLLLVFAMVFSMVATAVPASAASSNEFVIVPDKTEVAPGDTVTYSVVIGPIENFQSANFTLIIPEGLTFVSGAVAEGLKELTGATEAGFENSTLTFYHGGLEAYTCDHDTVLMTFTCTVNADASGAYEIQIMDDYDFADNTWNSYDMIINTAASKITVAEKSAPAFAITPDKTEVAPGDTVTYSVVIGPIENFQSANFTLIIPEGLTFVSGTVAEGLKELTGATEVGFENSTLTFYHGGLEAYTCDHNTVLMTFTCTVNADASGAYEIQIMDDYDFADNTWNSYDMIINTAASKITVVEKSAPATGIVLNKETLSLKVGGSETLVATLTPADATDVVVWTSSDNAVATVDANGKVTAVAEGNATITAQAGDVSATCVVTTECAHSNTTEHPAKESTCTEQGNGAYTTCDDCGDVIEGSAEKLPLNPDNHVDITTVPADTGTCINPGHAEYSFCNDCESIISGSDSPVTGPHGNFVEKAEEEYLKTVADCDSATVYYKSCELCGEAHATETFTYGSPLGHSFTNYVSNNDATCTEDGTKTAKCDRCEKTDTTTDIGSTLGHGFGDWYVSVEAKCEVAGEERRDCSRCSHFEIRATDALVHNYIDEVTDPDCTTDGYTTHTCSYCGHKYTDNVIPALGHSFATTWSKDENGHWHECERCDATNSFAAHDYSDGDKCVVCEYERVHIHRLTLVPAVDATCTTDGNVAYYTCSGCENWFEDVSGSVVIVDKATVVIHALGHDLTEATCTETCYCKREGCGHVEGTALGHSFTNYVSDGNATCEADGTKTAKCDRCDVTDTVTDTGSAKGHSYGNWYVTKEGKCETEGQEQRDCKNCTHYETRVVAATGHNYTSKVTAPACTEDGYTTYTCSKCQHSYKADVVPALGHSYDKNWSMGKDTHWHECERCNHKKDEGKHADNTADDRCDVCGYQMDHVHRLTLVPAVDATCTTDGHTAYYTCSGCADWFKDAAGKTIIADKSTVIIKALGHDMSKATCTEAAHCQRKGCNYVEGTALGHSFTKYTSNNDATCTEDGTKTAKCDRCDVTDTVTDTGSAKGHSYGNWYVTKEAKCETEGQEQRDCKNCKHYETRVIAATGHNYTSQVTAPTCTEDGYTTYTCSNCGHSYVDDYVDALGHNYQDGECTRCGQGEYHVKFRSTNLALGGNIGLNFIVELSENLVKDESAFIRFTYQNYVVEIPLSEGVESVKDGVTRYIYSCPITSRHMTDAITAQIYNANGPVGDSASDSVRNYCDRLFKINKDPKLADLMHAMLNYGAAAQIQFDYKPDDLANSLLTEEQKELHYVDLSEFAIQKIGKDEGIKAATATMFLDSETTIRIYYRLLGDKPIDAYTITIDGEAVEPTPEGDRYYVEIQDIAAHRLDDMHTITAGNETLIYGPMSFAYTVLTKEPEGSSFYNLALALYAYSAAAEAYIK